MILSELGLVLQYSSVVRCDREVVNFYIGGEYMAKMTTKQKLETIKQNPKLWIENFVKIVNPEGELVPFKLHEQQEELLNGLSKFTII